MPVNNTHAEEANPINNWANITASQEDMNFNDRIARIGSREGNSNTRLYSYSGQNVIVSKIIVGITESTAKIAFASTADFDPDADYESGEAAITLKVGESVPAFFHTQYTNTWGRDGYANSEIDCAVSDERVISYVGSEGAEGIEPNTLTALSTGTATLTATVADAPGRYAKGATFTLTVTVVE